MSLDVGSYNLNKLQEDLLERAALVGRELRETAEGLAVLKHEVSALRESIRLTVSSRELDVHVLTVSRLA